MLSAMKGDGSYKTFKTSQSGLRSNFLRYRVPSWACLKHEMAK